MQQRGGIGSSTSEHHCQRYDRSTNLQATARQTHLYVRACIQPGV